MGQKLNFIRSYFISLYGLKKLPKEKIQKDFVRVERSREEAKQAYDKMSSWYDLFSCFEKRYRNIGLEKLDVQEGEKVLEIGFGTGHCVLSLAKSVGSSGKVFGIDISEGMFQVTSSKLQKAGLSDRVELICDDAISLPYVDQFFDAVFICFTLELFDNPEIPQVLAECQRVLSPNGRMCVVSLNKKPKDSLMVRIYEWFHKKFPRRIDCRPIPVQEVMTNAHFTIIDKKELSMWGLPVIVVLANK
ncbi:MAG: methyltransferase domain-containing protein [Candidatus Heimdallarchaeota archaeon]|nr:methyltransferase domain-containing protein [Candidatus Heimdallarchaeota archaeon]